IPQEQFVAAWNGAGSLPEAVGRVKELAGGAVPRWAVMARAAALRKGGVEMRSLPAVPVVSPETPRSREPPRPCSPAES
ncbi:MAG: hypothetical protein JWO38_4799, partial [Gemmataceae bacterium]|nr:hypothetical protein [Gemmataceae bacterium]